MSRYILVNKHLSEKLSCMVEAFTSRREQRISGFDAITLKPHDQVVFCADMNAMGDDPFVSGAISHALAVNADYFLNVQGAFLVASDDIYFTKSYAMRMMFLLNLHGMYFLGHALMETIEDYKNFATWQKVYSLSLREVCQKRVAGYSKTLDDRQLIVRKNLLVLHASQRKTSNTLMLWDMVQKHLKGFNINVTHVENGDIIDCKGCTYTTCLHYAENKSCYYGGMMTREVLPAVEWADIIVWVCPNYNDAVSAMHTALINRLTVLYRRISLRPKQFYGVIVSANSGGDVVAAQLISALNLNKGMMLPPKAMLCETANDPGVILEVDGIEQKALVFAKRIVEQANL